MKELSIEEKAKAYDEALNWMRDLYPNLGIAAKEKAESIFKELRESEDERIRKRIIHALHGDVLNMEETTKAIAWLEKQGEQKFAWSEEDEEYLRRAINAVNNTYPMTANWLKSLKERIGG